MTDEIASSVLSGSTKTVETALEIIRMLAPAAKNLLAGTASLGKKGVQKVISKAINNGAVSNARLIAEAEKAHCTILSNSNFLARDAEIIAEKAAKYNVPVAIVGEGEKKTVEFLSRDKAVINQITQEIMQERLKGAPESVKSFSVSPNNAAAIKALLYENGVECQFVNDGDKIKCVYPAEYAEQVAVLKNEYKAAYAEIEENLGIAPNVPETERQIEIKSQIEDIENSRDNAELRGKYYDEFLSKTEIEFPTYSDRNMELVEEQMPDAKQVAGKAFWEKQGFKMNEDAKGVEIFAPQVDDNGNPVLDENGKQLFTTTVVYDISQTNAFEKSLGGKIDELQREYNTETVNSLKDGNTIKVELFNERDGNSVEITVDKKMRKPEVKEILKEKLGYSEMQADLAANKLCRELGLDEKKFNAHSQVDNLNALKTNIRYPSDDISLRDVRFDAVNFKDGETTHILLQNGEKSAALSPETMSKTEMINICKDKLGMSEQQAELAVAKAVKIDSQIKSKIAERTIDEKGISQEIHIERTGAQTFTVQLGDKSKFYNANTINLEDKIAKDFGIPKENARNIISKAKSQSLLQNKIAKSTSSKKAAPTPKIELGKGKKR